LSEQRKEIKGFKSGPTEEEIKILKKYYDEREDFGEYTILPKCRSYKR